MVAKKLARKDVIRLSRQKLWVDIGKAVDAYEKRVYGEHALMASRTWPKRASVETTIEAYAKRDHETDYESREGDITSVEEIEKILPPQGKKRRHAEPKHSPVSEHICGVAQQEKEQGWDDKHSLIDPDGIFVLGKSEERVLVLIAQSAGGMSPAQLKLAIPKLAKRTIQNILTALKGLRFIIKDENHGKFRATKEGSEAVKGRTAQRVKGAFLEELSESEKKIFFAIAAKPEGVTLSSLTTATSNLRLTKRTRSNILTALKTRELIEKIDDRFTIPIFVRVEIGDKIEKPLKGVALREHLKKTLPDGEGLVFEWLERTYENRPDPDASGSMKTTRLAEVLAETYSPRTILNIITALKSRELIHKPEPGTVALRPELFT